MLMYMSDSRRVMYNMRDSRWPMYNMRDSMEANAINERF